MESWIGIDEAGKGDYFGPLVIAAVHVDEEKIPFLTDLGVKDSKSLSDGRVIRMEREIRSRCVHSIVAIGPERYNKLYCQMRNLNLMLAWGHARALENVLSQTDCTRAISDQFGDKRLILNALLQRGKHIQLEQRPKAEADLGVAAASIVARAQFLTRLQKLSQKVDMELPKGASQAVEVAAKRLVQTYGMDILSTVAKVHFKTTTRIAGTNEISLT